MSRHSFRSSVPLLSLIVLTASPCLAYVLDGIEMPDDVCTVPCHWWGGTEALAVDIVGDTSHSNSAAGRAKGNSFEITDYRAIDELEFWLDFTSTQTLTFYVFEGPQEFGTYTEVYRSSQQVTGTGPGWYSSGPVGSTEMYPGQHYIIAVSWDGTLTYFYGTGDSQPVSFGSQTHGYATGYDPLPSTIQSTSNDQAIYHQRITTSNLSLDRDTWAGIKAVLGY